MAQCYNLQKDLDGLSVWESQWDMEFNHTTARKVINSVYTLHGQILEVVTVTSAKYLGVDTSGGLY